MADLLKKIAGAKKSNGAKSYTDKDRELAIETAVSLGELSTSVKVLSKTNQVKHADCERERNDLWQAVGGLREKVGDTREKTAANKGMIQGKQTRIGNVGMWIGIAFAGAAALGGILSMAYALL